MIIVEIFVPALGITYNFRLSPDVAIGTAIDELTDMICQKEKLENAPGAWLLCDADHGRILDAEHSLSDYSIRTGARLLLV